MATKRAARPITKQVPITHEGKEYWVEVINDRYGFSHRIGCSDGRITGWAAYASCAYMDGLVSTTAYYVGTGTDIALIPAAEFCKQTMVGCQ